MTSTMSQKRFPLNYQYSAGLIGPSNVPPILVTQCNYIPFHRSQLDSIFQLRPGVINFYLPKRSFGQGNAFTCVCDSVNRGGGVL